MTLSLTLSLSLDLSMYSYFFVFVGSELFFSYIDHCHLNLNNDDDLSEDDFAK